MANYSTSTDSWAGQSVNIFTTAYAGSAYTSWGRITATFTVPATAVGLRVQIENVSAQASGVTLRTCGWQLELGSTATTFSRAGGTIQGELAACQRYYQRWTGTTGGVYLGFGNAASTASCYPLIQGLQLRTLPTSIDYASVTASDTGAGITVTSINIWAGEGKTVLLQVNAAGGSYALLRGYYISLTSTSAYIGLSAEL